MAVLYRCPGCKQKLKIADRKIGHAIRCPACGTESVVQDPNVAATPSKPKPKKSTPQPKPVDPKPVEADVPPSPPFVQPAAEAKPKPDKIVPAKKEDPVDDPVLEDELDKDGLLEEDDLLEEVAPTAEASEETDSISDEWFQEESDETVEDSISKSDDLDLDDDHLEEDHIDEERFEDEEATSTQDVPPQQPPVPLYYSEEEEGDDDNAGFTVSRRAAEDEDMDLTPMVDVTFLLLIFFMITASFNMQKTIQIPPPEKDDKGVTQSVDDPEKIIEESIQVEITAENTIIIDEETELSDPGELEDKLVDLMSGSDGKNELVLSIDDKSLHEMTILVIDVANKIDIQKIRMVSSGSSGD